MWLQNGQRKPFKHAFFKLETIATLGYSVYSVRNTRQRRTMVQSQGIPHDHVIFSCLKASINSKCG